MSKTKAEQRTIDRIDEIKRVWEPGMSAADIAVVLSWKPTRNAVIGMFTRHAKLLEPCVLTSSYGKKGRPRHGTTVARAKVAPPPSKPRAPRLAVSPKQAAKPEKILQEEVDEVVDLSPVTIDKLGPSNATAEDYIDTDKNFLGVSVVDHKEGQCRWPSEGVTMVTFCGCPTEGNSVYCARHQRRGTKQGRELVQKKKVWRDERRR